LVAELNENDIREQIVNGVAWVRDIERADLDGELAAAGGDLRIDSKEGEAICILVEDVIGLGDVVEASDLRPEELTSISSLTRLFTKRIGEHKARTGKDAA
jgi:hypothetical protein